jgi:hypothetical protein
MPAKSKAQFRLFKAAESKPGLLPGMSKQKIKEYTKGNKGQNAYSKLKEKKGA